MTMHTNTSQTTHNQTTQGPLKNQKHQERRYGTGIRRPAIRQMQQKKEVTAVIGLGYVGLPLALLAERKGHHVIGVDIDNERVETLTRREAPAFLNKSERAQVSRLSSMKVATDASSVSSADVVVVCVPTPVLHNHLPDLRPLITACESIALYIKPGALVIIESTVNPGVCEEVVLPILENGSQLRVEDGFFFAHCPERINPGDEQWDVHSIPRVLGASGAESKRRAISFYRKIMDAEITPMATIKEAEAVKMVENSFRDINIAFVNELAMSFQKLGIDIMHVIEGASTKPFGFMPHYPGCGVGGHCIPVDPYYLIAYAKKNGFRHQFLETARTVNNGMPHYTVNLLEQALEDHNLKLAGSKIALLGLAYKRDIPDLRESPALVIEQELSRRGAVVYTFDPFVLDRSSVRTLDEVLRGARAALIATDHSFFRILTPKDFAQYGVSVVIDGRNCLDKNAFPKAGITYRGIGRS